jgi:hypothetical protein
MTNPVTTPNTLVRAITCVTVFAEESHQNL